MGGVGGAIVGLLSCLQLVEVRWERLCLLSKLSLNGINFPALTKSTKVELSYSPGHANAVRYARIPLIN